MVESNDVKTSWEIYSTAEPEYERYYFDIDSGGFVLIHREHSTTASEIFVAESLAKQGKQVKFLSERSELREKTADAEVDGELWEFKELRNATNVRGAVQRDIRDGKKQARNIVYHINQHYNILDINEGIRSAVRMDSKRLIGKITLIYNSCERQTFTREQLKNGQNFR
ncbi:hypothetical protein BCD67_12190 [Oscillatoriales cyanobacterium USR001]|nr:hypothetical protein BCD67_12190 [Oscillatoriales cyanobacterium USR001]